MVFRMERKTSSKKEYEKCMDCRVVGLFAVARGVTTAF